MPAQNAERRRRGQVGYALVLGGLAGLVGALAMTGLLLVLRDALGLPTPSELVGDRLTAYISIQQFFALLDQFGGYSGLKQAGGGGVIAGQLVVGLLGGLVYGLYASSHRRAWPAAAGIVAGLWLLSVGLLWPNLDTNYLGLPPDSARWATMAGLLVCYALYGLVLVGACSIGLELNTKHLNSRGAGIACSSRGVASGCWRHRRRGRRQPAPQVRRARHLRVRRDGVSR